MGETRSHKQSKTEAAGSAGQTEVPLPRGRRLDALSGRGRATEIERSGAEQNLKEAARRLRDAPAKQHVLRVPQPHMAAAVGAMKTVGVSGTVKNLSGTKRRIVQT